MSLRSKFFPKQEIIDNLSYKEKEQLLNLIWGDLICVPLFLIFTVVLVVFGVMDVFDITISYLIGSSTVFFIVSIILIKTGHIYIGSYFATFGFLSMTTAIVFFAPTAELPDGSGRLERSTFVSYRTGVFCVLMAIMNFFLSIRNFQLLVFHISSLVMLIISSFTVYMDIYQAQPAVMISSIVINGIGIFAANYLLHASWKTNNKILLQSEDARHEVEDLNKTLEDKVEERTRDLSEANKNLADINRRAERDMALAVNVQRAFYPHAAPEVDGWEVAYTFNPMAGVSGDLYDFFTDGKKLKGCCLFDVSGHGIASGLVTMLSKTIIAREFEKGLKLPLSKVMLNINDAIGHDKGDIENYLTGVLLRFEENKVEYVNGAHPALLCRSGSTGKVSPAKLDGEQGGGSLIGIRELPASFTGINFNMKSGDSLMIYTDCLYESRNDSGEEFGADRVAEIFANVGNGSAQDQLAKLIRQFRDFTGSVPLNDDLTVIVIKKL
ncbi:MAG: SpoIIE family protein phosphatase [Treponemataceae bacterium]|nr:SpoIIE family protein phosphatase [Spirochaetales bacterium]MDY6031661.1 SpoIIE family protein phosphatase [Treponemataceae bacterium]